MEFSKLESISIESLKVLIKIDAGGYLFKVFTYLSKCN